MRTGDGWGLRGYWGRVLGLEMGGGKEYLITPGDGWG